LVRARFFSSDFKLADRFQQRSAELIDEQQAKQLQRAAYARVSAVGARLAGFMGYSEENELSKLKHRVSTLEQELESLRKLVGELAKHQCICASKK
jgi:hypothetical protein